MFLAEIQNEAHDPVRISLLGADAVASGEFCPGLDRATWAAYQKNLLTWIAFYLGCDNFTHFNEYK
ncbi:hypothetical protein [Methylomicrobium lacus]|uniref:hypothetical protein n=1 Tax=Methylomicrobium lacus TaxID=136992 RepID=UPI0004B372A3|nr:hypothetical protein [Methylomicrobium lacus]